MSNKKNVFMFSGQGSQYFHMGAELYENNNVFKEWMDKLDKTAFKIIGKSVVNYIYDLSRQKSDSFDNLIFSHPAIFMVEFSLAQVLFKNGIKPDYLLGASLGEFTSLALANVFDYNDVLENIIKQADIIQRTCQEGGMLAVLDSIDIFYDNSLINQNSEIVANNLNNHFVIASSKENLKNIIEYLNSQKIINQLLPVSYAFHSNLITNAKYEYQEILKDFDSSIPTIKIVSSLNAEIESTISSNYLWNVVRKPILFKSAIDKLEKIENNLMYIDLGPYGTLSTFVKNMLSNISNSATYAVMTPFGNEVKSLNKIIS